MIRALAWHSFRGALPVTLALGAGLCAVETLLAYVLPTFRNELYSSILAVRFVTRLVSVLAGAGAEGAGPELLDAFPWVHPVVLALIWAHEVVMVTRSPVGEIDRGTIDVLLALPVSRWQLYAAETLACVAASSLVIVLGVAGFFSGSALAAAPAVVTRGSFLRLIANLGALCVAVGGAGLLVSAASERRGRAVGTIFALLIASFLLTFLADFWEPIRSVAFLSVLEYYRPLRSLQGAEWPIRDIAVLLGAGLTAWVVGGVVFARRDIHTV